MKFNRIKNVLVDEIDISNWVTGMVQKSSGIFRLLKYISSYLDSFNYLFFNWWKIALLCCVGFCCTSMWISWIQTYVHVCVCVCVKSLQSCLTLCDPVDCSPSASSVHGILQARILESVAFSFFLGIFPISSYVYIHIYILCTTYIYRHIYIHAYTYIHPLFGYF